MKKEVKHPTTNETIVLKNNTNDRQPSTYEIISYTSWVHIILNQAAYYLEEFTKRYEIEKQLPGDNAVGLTADQLISILAKVFHHPCPAELMLQMLENPVSGISKRIVGGTLIGYRIYDRGEPIGSDTFCFKMFYIIYHPIMDMMFKIKHRLYSQIKSFKHPYFWITIIYF